MLIAFKTGMAVGKQPAFPFKINAPLGEAFFDLQNMVNGNGISEVFMGLMPALKYVLPFELVDDGKFFQI